MLEPARVPWQSHGFAHASTPTPSPGLDPCPLPSPAPSRTTPKPNSSIDVATHFGGKLDYEQGGEDDAVHNFTFPAILDICARPHLSPSLYE